MQVTIQKTPHRPKEKPNPSVDELVGIQLKAALAARKLDGAKFGRDLGKFLGSDGKGWNRQTVYEAGQGKRKFRVSELVAFARVLNVPAHHFLDAQSAGIETVGDGAEAVDAGALRDLLRVPEPRSAGRDQLVALHEIEVVIDQLEANQRDLGAIVRLLNGTYWEELKKELTPKKDWRTAKKR